ncbi:MAG: DUF2017 family protein [Planctomycetes bacterium]|nr:DUF2017 family protein [Planctomycetota bacterium]
MNLERSGRGELVFRDLPRICADALRVVPVVLESDDPRVRDRRLPRVYEDDALEQEWRRIGAPELEHLFVSRTELIRKDLSALERRRDGSFTLRVPERHEAAWLSGLNAARHALFLLNALEPADMERDPAELDDPRRALALLHIHWLAYLQELMLHAESPPAP